MMFQFTNPQTFTISRLRQIAAKDKNIQDSIHKMDRRKLDQLRSNITALTDQTQKDFRNIIQAMVDVNKKRLQSQQIENHKIEQYKDEEKIKRAQLFIPLCIALIASLVAILAFFKSSSVVVPQGTQIKTIPFQPDDYYVGACGLLLIIFIASLGIWRKEAQCFKKG